MESAGHILALIGLDLVILFGLIGIPLGLGGNFVLLGAGVLVGILTGFEAVGWIALIIMAVGVVLGEVIEAVLGSFVALKYGASKWGMIGAFVGGLLGAVAGTAVLPLIGSLIGSFLGAGVGAVALELASGQAAEPGFRAGLGAFIGKILATTVKVAIGSGIAIYLILRTHG